MWGVWTGGVGSVAAGDGRHSAAVTAVGRSCGMMSFWD